MWCHDHGAALGRRATTLLYTARHRFCARDVDVYDRGRGASPGGRRELG